MKINFAIPGVLAILYATFFGEALAKVRCALLPLVPNADDADLSLSPNGFGHTVRMSDEGGKWSILYYPTAVCRFQMNEEGTRVMLADHTVNRLIGKHITSHPLENKDSIVFVWVAAPQALDAELVAQAKETVRALMQEA